MLLLNMKNFKEWMLNESNGNISNELIRLLNIINISYDDKIKILPMLFPKFWPNWIDDYMVEYPDKIKADGLDITRNHNSVYINPMDNQKIKKYVVPYLQKIKNTDTYLEFGKYLNYEIDYSYEFIERYYSAADIPTWDVMVNGVVDNPDVLVHYTDWGVKILKNGFVGIKSPYKIALSRASEKGSAAELYYGDGYIFSYSYEDCENKTIQTFDFEQAVLFQSDAIKCYHNRDEEYQYISYSTEAQNIVLAWYDKDSNIWVVKKDNSLPITDDNINFKNKTIKELTKEVYSL